MKKQTFKKWMQRLGAPLLAGVIALSSVATVGAAAVQVTPSGDTVTRISNPDGKPGEADGYIGDREIGYGWSFAERDGYLYIGGWRNTVGAVIKLYLESALVASGKMDSETVWNLVNIITNGEVPYPTKENAGVLIKMNRANPGEFEVIAETKEPFRHVAKYEDDLYFTTYIGGSDATPVIYKLDKNDALTPVYSTKQGSSMRANCIYRDRLYFAGTRADEALQEGGHCQLAVIQLNETGDAWNSVADWRDFTYETADGETGYYADDSFVSATAGSPFWDMVAYDDEIYATIPNMLGYVVFRGHPAKEGEKANAYGWVWTEVIGRDKNSPNNQGLSKTDKRGFTDGASYALGYQSVVGALGVYDGKLYAYDIDHTISAELAGIQGMLTLMSDPGNPNLSAYLNPLVTTLHHAQTLWRMDETNHTFSEVQGFTALTEGTTNEYIWKHGVYNGEFYISTMDSKVIYNYLTRLTGGSFADMSKEEKQRQITYIANFVKKLIVGKLSEFDIHEFADKILNPDTETEKEPTKLDELKAKLAKTVDDIASMEQWQKMLLFMMGYLDARSVESPAYAEAMAEMDRITAKFQTLDIMDEAAVNAFVTEYNAAALQLTAALEEMENSIREISWAMTETEADVLTGIMDEIIDNVIAATTGNFREEIAKIKDVIKAVGLYNQISTVVKDDTQGFDIFKTADGDNWEVVTDNGFGDKFNYGALRFVTTEEGMYVTTANPFYGAQLYLISNDRKPVPETKLTVENADVKWQRGSSEPVILHTDSQSAWATVRKDGKLFGYAIENGVSIVGGDITLSPALLESLPDGKTALTVTTDEGAAVVNVQIGSVPGETRKLGDANLDGKVTIDDVTSIQMYLAQTKVLSETAAKVADVDGDGQVTINDATDIQRFLAELQVAYRIGEDITI